MWPITSILFYSILHMYCTEEIASDYFLLQIQIVLSCREYNLCAIKDNIINVLFIKKWL